ncbi:dihydrolipoamide acetyltransferase component of pyruvate dehydrogenase complex [Sphaerisporangium rufum]|uniref:Dihydrolipoamide acetyltransferase component of pyruvate dehydrogenase complex n=1 Tax=Sphaerisporangium rufum TaxID=1381558 RepID=A0A919R900_9ACTN|nr:2-oxo acid dehydrogenase subunit E2 [Sphaerisporangium rufum]GII81872.1 dihydrolipoamide acetyltransferase component of pyruvate dehydrogenase complex [Sphaerisporangium rufum]
MTGVVVPKLNNNDARYLLLEWVAADGAPVRAGEPVALVETSKTVEELEAPAAGVLCHLLAAGAECEPGQTIGRLGDAPASGDPASTAPGNAVPAPDVPDVPVGSAGADRAPAEPGMVITAPARRLMEELGIGEERVRALGRPLVRREDVAALASPAPAAPAPDPSAVAPATPGPVTAPAADDIVLSRTQRRIGEVVGRTHREVPAAYTAVTIDVEEALRLARELTPRLRTLVGLPELLVKAVAGLAERFATFFATPLDAGRLRRAATANVGVTMDVGNGLFVPVVRDATGRSLADVSRAMMAHRLAAVRGGLREEDLAGANIVVTLHTEGMVTLAIPIIFPGQVCALSLAAPQREVVPFEDGFEVRHMVTLGLAFDHRYVNGRDAVLFLDAVRTALESPADLAGGPR